MAVIFHVFFHTSTGHENSGILPIPAIFSNKINTHQSMKISLSEKTIEGLGAL